MIRTPSQEVARRLRRDRSHTFAKCPCGNVAGLNQTHCGACRDRADDMESLKARIADLERLVLGEPRINRK